MTIPKRHVLLDKAITREIDTYTKDAKKLMTLLLTQIRADVEAREQWRSMEDPSTATEYHHRLQALVELLEVFDCGSTGGFGKGQPGNHTLIERAGWLLIKYGG